jgi:hypothetical protein
MKTKILILVALILGTTSFTPDDKSKNQTEYQVVRDESGIRISTRWIPVTDTRSARQIKCEFTVDGPVRNVIAVLNNDNSIVTWMKGTK